MSRSSFVIIFFISLILLALVFNKLRRSQFEALGDSIFSFASNSMETNRNGVFHAAILVAGSRGYANYRHQADMCNAYQLLRKRGLHDHDIVTFIYDDIVFDSRNPFQGQLFNKPGGKDVYPGCAKDYTGEDVNKRVLFTVLRGDSESVRGIGSGRVLRKDPNQRVFFAYSDHGDAGVIGFPTGPFLYADEFNKMVVEMKRRSMFSEMLIYLESCYAGSMFTGMDIEKEDTVLAIAASGPYESSYATYCPTMTKTKRQKSNINPTTIGSCMGDLFTVSWIEDTKSHSLYRTSLLAQLIRVATRTSNQNTYFYGSHVKSYGDKNETIRHRPVGAFLSNKGRHSTRSSNKGRHSTQSGNKASTNPKATPNFEGFEQKDADLLYLYMQASKNKENSNASVDLDKELEMRRLVDEAIYTSLEGLVLAGDLPIESSIAQFARDLIPRAPEEAIVSNWDCLKEMVAVWEAKCGKLNTYSGQYTRTFANLCNAAVSPSSFSRVITC